MRIEDVILDAGVSPSVIDEEGRHEAREILGRTAAVVRALAESGVRADDTVALAAENGVGFIAGLLGILACGGAAVVVDPAWPFPAVERVLRSARVVAICFAGSRPRRMLEERWGDLQGLAMVDAEAVGRSDLEDFRGARRSGLSGERAAVVLYSSGTSGLPKGAVLSHRAILSNMHGIGAYLLGRSGASTRERFYVAKSMVHSSTLVGEVLLGLSFGASIVALNPVVPATQMFRRIHEHRATIVCVNPSLLHFFAGAGLKEEWLQSLHTIHVSGAIVNRKTFLRVHERFPWIRLINGYGLTEAGPRVARLATTEALKPGSVGKAIQGVSLEVRRASGAACAAHEVGEVFVRSPGLMEGYLGPEGLTRAELVQGALRTGDLGYVDEDGDLFITGRVDDLIITGGHNVDPCEIEEVVLRTAGVGDCIVFGVEDEVLGRRLVCAYTPAPDEIEDDVRLRARLRHACAGALAGYQMPKTFCRWSDIPLTPGGKKSRVLAERRYREAKDDGR